MRAYPIPVPAWSTGLVAAAVVGFLGGCAQTLESPPPNLIAKSHARRRSPEDLEIRGDLAGLPYGTTRYLSRDNLLALPQVTYTVSDDPDFTGPTEVSGVALENLTRALARAPDADLVIAISKDLYRAHYPKAYLAVHHPFLSSKVNGQSPEGRLQAAEGHGQKMGPYMISHRAFTPGLSGRGADSVACGSSRISQ